MITKPENHGKINLFGKTRSSILSLLFGNPGAEYYLRQIVRLSGSGLGPVQRELKTLTESGIIVREKRGTLVYYRANESSPVFDELKSIVVKSFGITDVIRQALVPLSSQIRYAFVFGSMARGDFNTSSDIDLMIIGIVSFNEVSTSISKAEKSIGREINPVVYSELEFAQQSRSENYFINNVLEDKKIFLIGDEVEFTSMVGRGQTQAS